MWIFYEVSHERDREVAAGGVAGDDDLGGGDGAVGGFGRGADEVEVGGEAVGEGAGEGELRAEAVVDGCWHSCEQAHSLGNKGSTDRSNVQPSCDNIAIWSIFGQ